MLILLLVSTHLIKIGNDLIKQPKALHPLIVPIQFHVKLMVVGNRGEQHARALVRVVVQILPTDPLSVIVNKRASVNNEHIANEKQARDNLQ